MNRINPLVAYAGAVLAVVVAVLIRLLADPFLSDRLPFVTLFAAIACVAFFFGKGPAIVTTAVGAPATAYFICHPRGSLAIEEPAYVWGMVFYVGLGLLFTFMLDGLRRSRRLADENAKLMRTTFASIGDGVITTDVHGNVTEMNPVAEHLTGWSSTQAVGRPLEEVFDIVNETTGDRVENPAKRSLEQGVVVGLANHTNLISKTGEVRAINDSAAPIRDDRGLVSGAVLVFRDVTQERQEIREQQSALQALNGLVASAPDGIAIFDDKMRFLHINARLAEMNGIPAADHLGKTIQEVVPDLYDQVADLFQQVIESGKSVPDTIISGETPKNPGEIREWRESWFPIADEDGTASGVGVIVRDITDERRTERALAQMVERTTSLVDNSPLAVIEWNADLVITRWAGLSEKVFGWTAAEVIGKRFRDLSMVHEHEAAAVESTMAKLADPNTRFIVNRSRNKTKSGEEVWCEWYNSLLRDADGKLVSGLSLVLDVTQREQAAQALQASEKRLAFELESTHKLQELSLRSVERGEDQELYLQMLETAIGIMHSDMASMQIAEEEGPEGSSTIVLKLLAWKGFHPESAKHWERIEQGSPTPCRGASEHGTRSIVADVDKEPSLEGTRDLEEFRRSGISSMQSTPLFSRSGRLLGVISTHWREPYEPVENELRAFDILARQVADLIERKQTDLALRESDRRKDEFLATLAHELRNPLAPVTNALELMKSAAGNPELMSQARAIMERQVAQMVRLIDDLLDVSRIVRDKLELKTSEVELAPIIHQAVESVRPLTERAGQALLVAVPDQPIYLEADPARLAQVFGNLLTNASRYTEHGGRVCLSLERQGDSVMVSVEDTGVGIPSEMLPRVFDLFTQVDRSVEHAGGGLGIGLSLVRRLVEMHGGTVVAHSEGPGKGSEFVVRLPVYPANHQSPKPTEPSAVTEDDANSYRILIVDDNVDNATTLAKLLGYCGHQTHLAHDGPSALREADQFLPEVILLDIGLPEINGHEVCRRLRKRPWGDRVAIIALTGWGQDEDRRQSKEAGFDDHMVKPADLATLEQMIARHAAKLRLDPGEQQQDLIGT